MAVATNGKPTCLHGDVVLEDGSVARSRYVLIVDGKIQSVSADKPRGIRKPHYTLADDELIFPAFLDLHTHSSYNMLPLWSSPYWAWDNRFQWRENQEYRRTVEGMGDAIVSACGNDWERAYTAFNAFSELMAVAGGSTVLQENAHLSEAGYPRGSHVLIRSTGSPRDMGLDDVEEIVSTLQFYEPGWVPSGSPPQDTSSWKVNPAPKGSYGAPTYLADFSESVTLTRARGTIVHLAEGRSGFLQTVLGPDAYSRAEFETFKDFISSKYMGDDVASVQRAHLLLIHGCGMNTVSNRGLSAGGGRRTRGSTIAETVRFLKTYDIGVLWSPVSNLLLYQDTTNVIPLLDAEVRVVLGTDWTPSGSKTVWEEAKFAADFLEARGWKGNVERTCFQAITSAAADALGVPLGRVSAGNFGDLLIVRRPVGAKRGDALRTFRTAGDREVRCVLVGGVPLYGEADVLKALGAKPHPLPDERPAEGRQSPVAASKAFSLPEGCGITLPDLTEVIHAADRVVGRDRPRLLASDDPAYRTRIEALRKWLHDFDPKTSPNPKPTPPPPSGLAPGELEWMYNPKLDPKYRIPAPVADFLGRVAPCRDSSCPVPRLHPYYHAEVLTQAGDSYGFRVPCMPVIPVLTNQKRIFAMGDYPTAKFTARSTNNLPVITAPTPTDGNAKGSMDALLRDAATDLGGPDHVLEMYLEEIDDLVHGAFARPAVRTASWRDRESSPASGASRPTNQFFVPVGDVFAPMQDADYFDGYKVRNVAAGVVFQENYLQPVGIDLNEDVWLTNLIKCFLFHSSMADSYAALGWTDVQVQESYSQLLPAARACTRWIREEVQICDPQLVLTVGKPPCTLIHNVPFADLGLQGTVYGALLGVRLPAGDTRLEEAIADELRLTSSDAPPFSEDGKPTPVPSATAAGKKAKKQEPRPVSIVRTEPWVRFNVFHMMHPQAVMMSQTAVVSALLSAITAVLGPKAKGMSTSDLGAALTSYLKRHSTAELLDVLPWGQRDDFRTNASLLERHAVTMAELAETLAGLELGKGRHPGAEQVLAAQAADLANKYKLADSPAQELRRLKAQRAAQKKKIDGYLKGAPRGNRA